MSTETFIRILTVTALSGLLGTVGLRLTVGQVVSSLRKCRFTLILLVNFVVVPGLTLAAARVFAVRTEFAIGMLLLASAPLAPVVPVFAKMARADLALAAGLTSVIPVLSAFLTPFVCEVTLRGIPDSGGLTFKSTGALVTLLATITLPLVIGVVINHRTPAFGRRILGPVEATAEATGAMSLAFLVFTEFRHIVAMGWRPLVAMLVVMEISMLLGYWVGGKSPASRQVTALGTGNRNIALAVLVAIHSFAGTEVIAAVVANGLLMIVVGLAHVAGWRFSHAAAHKGKSA